MLDQSGEHSAMKKQMLILPVLVVLKIPFLMEQIYLQWLDQEREVHHLTSLGLLNIRTDER